ASLGLLRLDSVRTVAIAPSVCGGDVPGKSRDSGQCGRDFHEQTTFLMQAVGQFSRELRQRIGVPLKQVAFSGGRLEIHQSVPKYVLRSLVTYADLKTAPEKDAAASKGFLMCRLLHIDRQRTKRLCFTAFSHYRLLHHRGWHVNFSYL